MKKDSTGIFVTGTDTGIGKTFVSAMLALAAMKTGKTAVVMKPVASGAVPLPEGATDSQAKRQEISPDVLFLQKILNQTAPPDTINPLLFKAPLAPMVAAEISNREIDFDKIFDAYKALSQEYDVVIVEGIGGILVPLTSEFMIADLAAELSLPIIIVAGPNLGTLNHTLLTFEAAEKRRLRTLAIVLNYYKDFEAGLAERTNRRALEKLTRVPMIFEQKHISVEQTEALSEHIAPEYMEFCKKFL